MLCMMTLLTVIKAYELEKLKQYLLCFKGVLRPIKRISHNYSRHVVHVQVILDSSIKFTPLLSGATLAGCSCASRVLTWHHGVQLSARSSTSVPRGIVPASRRCRITATSSVLCPAAPGRTASPAQLLWPTGFLCGWSVGLEFPAGQLA